MCLERTIKPIVFADPWMLPSLIKPMGFAAHFSMHDSLVEMENKFAVPSVASLTVWWHHGRRRTELRLSNLELKLVRGSELNKLGLISPQLIIRT